MGKEEASFSIMGIRFGFRELVMYSMIQSPGISIALKGKTTDLLHFEPKQNE